MPRTTWKYGALGHKEKIFTSQHDKFGARDSIVRSVASGDVLPTSTPRAVQLDETGRAVDAANEHISSTVQHILSGGAAQDPGTLMDTIKTLMNSLSPDETAALRSVMREGDPAANDSAVSLAGCGHPAHFPPRIEGCLQCADASSASIVERLAAPDAADIEFEAPRSGGLFRAADFSGCSSLVGRRRG